MSKVKILFFAADPHSIQPDEPAPRLRLDDDVREIRQKVRAAKHRDLLEFDTHWAVRTDDLLQGLNEAHPQVVHFSGHGSENGLVLVSADGRSPHSVRPGALVELFRLFEDDIRVVVLNACFSLPQAEAIAQAVGCAIGTPAAISDTAAITFGASFYRAIAFGHSVKAAYDQACIALAMDDFGDEQCPRLVARPGVDPAKLYLIPPPRLELTGPPAIDPEPAKESAWLPEPRPVPIVKGRRGLGRVRMILTALAMTGVAAAASQVLVKRIQGPGGPNSTSGDSVSGITKAAEFPRTSSTGRPHDPSGRGSRPISADDTHVPDVPPPTITAPAGLEPSLASAVALSQRGSYEAAFPVFKRASEAGDPEAMVYLGLAYQHGQGTNRSDSLGALWLRKSAIKKRNVHAMNVLAAAYLDGEHLRPSLYWARHWYGAAVAEKRDVHAMYGLGRLNRNLQRFDSAFIWYGRAVTAGSVDARVDLGEMYEQGQGGRPDLGEARRLYREAAEAGSVRGRMALARLDQDRVGIAWDRVDSGLRSLKAKAAELGLAVGSWSHWVWN